MDSFIDRLAHRFTAQEIIKANATAEAEELKRTREQVRQYETCLEEMKQVNESMKDTLAKLENSMNVDCDVESSAKLSAEDLQEINDMLDCVLVEMTNTKEATLQQQSRLEEQITIKMQELQDDLNGQVVAKLQEMQDGMAEQMQVVRDGMSGQNGQILEDVMAEIANNKEESAEQQSRMEEFFAGQVQSVQDNVAERMQGIQEDQNRLGNQLLSQIEDLQEFQGKLPMQLSSQLQSLQDKLMAQMKTERTLAMSEKENASMFSDIQVAVLKEVSSSHADATKEQFSSKLTEQKEQLCDYVHKESVKVYRNVQAVVVDEGNKQTENVSQLLNKVSAKNQLMTKLVIASCACSGASLVVAILLLLRSLGLL